MINWLHFVLLALMIVMDYKTLHMNSTCAVSQGFHSKLFLMCIVICGMRDDNSGLDGGVETESHIDLFWQINWDH